MQQEADIDAAITSLCHTAYTEMNSDTIIIAVVIVAKYMAIFEVLALGLAKILANLTAKHTN